MSYSQDDTMLGTAKLVTASLPRAEIRVGLSWGSLDRVLDRLDAPRDKWAVLEGTSSQAKTLWWRNPWLLKLPRIALNPREPSMYGKLRPEPSRGHVSTLEAIADVLPALGEPEATRDTLRRLMRTMLHRVRDQGKPGA